MATKKRQAVSRAPKSGQGTKRGKRLAEKRTMLSIRLNERERALLTEAASFHEQSPTGFIKSAAISHAAHVVNTSKKTTLDFAAVAQTIATLLFTEEFYREYRTKYFTSSKHHKSLHGPRVRSEEILTLGESDDELDEWIGAVSFGEIPETWMEIDTSRGRLGKVTPGGDKHFEHVYVNPAAPIVRDDRVPMTKKDFLQLQRAVRLGGTEFVQRILQVGAKVYCDEEDLDEPIDPQTID